MIDLAAIEPLLASLRYGAIFRALGQKRLTVRYRQRMMRWSEREQDFVFAGVATLDRWPEILTEPLVTAGLVQQRRIFWELTPAGRAIYERRPTWPCC